MQYSIGKYIVDFYSSQLKLAIEFDGKKKQIVNVHLIPKNKSLTEDNILQEIKESSGIFSGVSDNVAHILEYAFLKILNNAIVD
jgi:hypothetical protein